MATIIELLILALIQAVTEWLPVSSSGHLVLAQKYMGLSLPVFFDVVLHFGSLLVVLIVFRNLIVKVLSAVVRLDFRSEDGKMAICIILGSIPTAIMGYVFKSLFESFFDNLLAVGVALLITGGFLFISERGKNRSRPLNRVDALLVGIAQGFALIPGISRSGATISTGLLRKVDRATAFTFSFLLFIPAVLGALVFTVSEAGDLSAVGVDYVGVVLALAITTLVGYVFLKALQRIVLGEKFHLFAYYCWALGFVVVLTQVIAMT